MLDGPSNVTNLTLTTTAQQGDILRILVENRGRLCQVAILDRKVGFSYKF